MDRAGDSKRLRELVHRVLERDRYDDADNQEFWLKVAPEERVEVLWELVKEQWRMEGLPGDVPRLDRSVVTILRR